MVNDPKFNYAIQDMNRKFEIYNKIIEYHGSLESINAFICRLVRYANTLSVDRPAIPRLFVHDNIFLLNEYHNCETELSAEFRFKNIKDKLVSVLKIKVDKLRRIDEKSQNSITKPNSSVKSWTGLLEHHISKVPPISNMLI